jgi:hypothetical protein
MEHGEKAGDLMLNAIEVGAFSSCGELAEILADVKNRGVNRNERGSRNGLFLCVANVLLKGEAAYGPGKLVYPSEHPGGEAKVVECERVLRVEHIDFRVACTLVAVAIEKEAVKRTAASGSPAEYDLAKLLARFGQECPPDDPAATRAEVGAFARELREWLAEARAKGLTQALRDRCYDQLGCMAETMSLRFLATDAEPGLRSDLKTIAHILKQDVWYNPKLHQPVPEHILNRLDTLARAMDPVEAHAIPAELSDDLSSPDARGEVRKPVDLSAYESASVVLQDHSIPGVVATHKQLISQLDAHPEIRRHHPRENRLLIHLADWARFKRATESATGDGWATPSEVERNKRLLSKKNRRGK